VAAVAVEATKERAKTSIEIETTAILKDIARTITIATLTTIIDLGTTEIITAMNLVGINMTITTEIDTTITITK
jgi:hypothetical protein